jgi:hypothetical protein
MASLWAARLPVVTVPQAAQPKPVTFVYPYYDNPLFFATQVARWRAYPPNLCAHVSAIVVDDGSSMPAALPPAPPFPIRLFRIAVDVPWNWLAARNIGAHHAPDGWLLLTDMDHVVPAETLRSLVWGQHDPAVVYAFSRREHTGAAIAPHSASFFLTRRLFWTIGGYDETLSGHYGTDGEFRRRVREYAPIQVLSDALVRHEYVGDSSTSRYRRKDPQDAVAVKRLIAARGAGWRPKVLSFPYVEVL